jgi:hypothetical protein
MSATSEVLELVERWAAAEQGNDAQRLEDLLADNSGRFRLTLVAARPADRWLLANAHIGMLQPPAGPPSS